MFELTKGQAIEFFRANRIDWKKSNSDFAEKLLLETGLFIKPEEKIDTVCAKVFSSASQIVRKRLQRLIDSVTQRKVKLDDKTRNEVLFDLRDFPELLNDDPASQSSQSSSTSRVSDISDLEIEIPSTIQGIRHKRSFPFMDVGQKSKRIRTQELYDLLLQTAKNENISPEQLAAYLGYRASHLKNKKTAAVFLDIFNGKPPNITYQISPTLALYLREACQIGRNIYTDLRLVLKDHVTFPAHQHLSRLEAEILPKLEVFENGWKINLKEAITLTLQRTFQNLDDKLTTAKAIEYGLVCKFVGGCDGSGSHAIYNSATSLAEGVDTSHMLVGGFALTEIRLNGHDRTTLYKDTNCSSSHAERPWVLIPGRETKEIFKKIMETFDQDISSATNEIIQIDNIPCQITFELSQLDGKAITTATGLGGAYCTFCKVSETEGKNIERIRAGFGCDRNIEELHSLFMSLTDNGNIEDIPTSLGDYSTRTGLTQQPQTHQDITKNIPVTHAYIRALSHFEKLVYHINADVRIMGRGQRIGGEAKEQLKVSKAKFQEEAARGPLHMRLDQPDSHGAGGSSDTGQTARQFFSQKKRADFIALLKGTEKEKEDLKKLHENYSVILRVMSSKEKEIDTESFEEFCLETYLHQVQSFPWASVPQSLHRILAHSAERIRMNDGFGLGSLSEEGLEATHKLVRRFRAILSRKTSLQDNLQDVFKHLWVRSDPVIRQHARVLECTNCFSQGHTRRSCPEIRHGCELEEDEKVNQFFVDHF
jgi:hypothetical protein